MPAHDPKAEGGPTTLCHEAGNNRMKWPLTRADTIGMSRIQRKPGTTVLHSNAGAGNDDAGTKGPKVRLNEGNHHAVAIRGRQIDRIFTHRQ